MTKKKAIDTEPVLSTAVDWEIIGLYLEEIHELSELAMRAQKGRRLNTLTSLLSAMESVFNDMR